MTFSEAKNVGRLNSLLLTEHSDRKVEDGLAITQTTEANLSGFHSSVQPALEQSCVACHGPEKAERANSESTRLEPGLGQAEVTRTGGWR